MYRTKIDIPEDARHKLVELLNARLADGIDLMLQGKQAHWNVKGPQFIALHELFDRIVEHAREWADDMAERAVTLGGTAQGTLQQVSGRTTLSAYPPKAAHGPEHLEALSANLAAFGKSVRTAIDQATHLGDADTADLFTSISRAADKDLWFLEAHLQA
jgi:starvation-inducible DNA-binding protein